jgi:hypothetical protein
MTFLRKYGYSAVGLTFMIGAFVMQWHILNEGFWHRVFSKDYFYAKLVSLIFFCLL